MSYGARAKFYKSKNWQECRNAYLKSVGGLCERCIKKGMYKGAEIIHHKEYLTDEKLLDPNISLCWDNLEALCRDCHAEEHSAEPARYKLDEMGRVIFKDEPTESINHRSDLQRGAVS